MSPTEIKTGMSQDIAEALYSQLGDPKAPYESMVAAVMVVRNLDEESAIKVVDFNLAETAQMEADMEIRGKFHPLLESD